MDCRSGSASRCLMSGLSTKDRQPQGVLYNPNMTRNEAESILGTESGNPFAKAIGLGVGEVKTLGEVRKPQLSSMRARYIYISQACLGMGLDRINGIIRRPVTSDGISSKKLLVIAITFYLIFLGRSEEGRPVLNNRKPTF